MVKLVVGEETRFKSAEDRLFQSGVPAEVGLIVGKLSPSLDRGLAYDLLPTPPTEAGASACSLRSEGVSRDDRRKGSKGGKAAAEAPPTLVIDADWVSEHARQVSRMLLGGMGVVGAYVWASEASFKATSPAVLSQAIRAIAQAAPWCDSNYDERLLIHISYSPRRGFALLPEQVGYDRIRLDEVLVDVAMKWACRNCALASGSLQPCDFKLGKLLASLQTFRCMYSFDIRAPISLRTASNSVTLKNVLHSAITSHAKDLHNAKALIDGNLVNGNQHGTSEGLHTVELLLPFMKDVSIEACRSEEVAGLVVFSGTICASAYLGSKEPISQAVSDIKEDIIHSLRSRLDIISDEAEDDVDLTVSSEGEPKNDVLAEKPIHQLFLHELRKPYHLSFPRRVLVPWLDGVSICDYLQPTETFEDLKDHCKEMMCMVDPIDASAISEPEAEATTPTVKSFWDVVRGDSAPVIDKPLERKHLTAREGSAKSKSNIFNIFSAILALILALLVGWAITVFGSGKAVH